MKRIMVVFLLVLLLLPISSKSVFADSGPKPDVTIDFNGLEGQNYYVTLLSKSNSSGPWDDSRGYDPATGKHIWEAFNTYKDKDRYYFLGYYEDCSGKDSFTWGYWPPEKFKILIYLPDTKEFIVSTESYDRYAFHSDFTATITDGKIAVEKASIWPSEVLPFIARVLLTLAIELCIALLFSYSNKKQIGVITITNVATQALLNVILFSMTNSGTDWITFYSFYLLLEIFIVLLEGFVYMLSLRRYEVFTEKKSKPWLYSAAANITSFFIGLILSSLIPGMF